ncbi:hypothetical protein D9758_007229 [Tetrapyrgos nigripes]|uniref:non-specific serine/threonine protein kinase n=1 Tax=Tetrapyrgos nigripes TaxID=182062 RepID=A0A8H5FWC7_9AGAR|nr:hypothetical protein D9758_007229 [Tetrapyrgos nigripes]
MTPHFLGRGREDPKQIGNWKLGRTLGQGAHGRVRVARNAKTGQMAAIKIIPKNSFCSRTSALDDAGFEAEQREIAMQREVIIMKLIEHPNIMRLYDVWDLPDELYLVLEYVQGGELFEYLCDNGALPIPEALSYFQQLVLAVDYCHRFNVAHRDLKPENILLDSARNVKIADFGLAAFQSEKLLQTACGSPHYTAPEVLRGMSYDGIIADVWSCGIILFALLVGRLPFDRDDIEDLIPAILDGYFELPSDLDPLAQDLIIKMLESDPEERITLAEVQEHPFFLSQPLKSTSLPTLTLEQISRPLRSREDVDLELFQNLCTLWRGHPESDLIDSLLSPEQNWQKGVYHLLFEYRRKRLEECHKQEQVILAERNRKREARRAARKMALASMESELRPSPSSLPPRAGPPTPRRARKGKIPEAMSDDSSFGMLGHCTRGEQQNLSLGASGGLRVLEDAMSPSLMLMNEIIKDRTMNGQSFSAQVETMATPDKLSQRAPFGIVNGGGHCSDSDQNLTHRGTLPLNVRSKAQSRTPRPVIDITFLDDDEEAEEYLIVDAILGEEENAAPFGFLTPRVSKLRKKRFLDTPSSVQTRVSVNTTGSSTRSSNLLTPRSAFSTRSNAYAPPNPLLTPTSGPRAAWFSNVFKFAKPSAYTLRSTHAIQTTRNECRRLLMAMDVRVSIVEDVENNGSGSGLGALKCKLDCNTHNIGNGRTPVTVKLLKFRVDIRRSTARQDDGDLFLVMVHEKGPMEGFKGVYRCLKEEWTLDVIGSKTPDQVAVSRSPRFGVSSRVL